MIYAFFCKDGGDKTKLRTDLLLQHLRYIETVSDKIVMAGPCPPQTPGDQRQFEGSVMMYRAASADEARSLFDGDPYAKNKVWDSVEMTSFTPVAGDYIGGVTWDIVDGKIVRKDPRAKVK